MSELPKDWAWSTVAQVGKVELGRQRHPDWHTGPEMRPYLRVANVFEDRIDTRDVKEMDFSGVFDRYKLHAGDVLLNEGQTPELLGRPAIYRGHPKDVAFTNTLIRFQAGPEVTPEWALAVFRHHMHSGRFARESRITTNIAHLSTSRFKTVEFPVPPLREQQRIVEILEDHLSRLDAAIASVSKAKSRAVAMVTASLSAHISQVLGGGCVEDTLGNRATRVEYGSGSKAGVWEERATPVLRMGNIKNGQIDWSSLKFFPPEHHDLPRLLLQPGDLLFNRTNSAEHVGKSAVFNVDRPATFASYLIRVRFDQTVHSHWANMVINSPYGRLYVSSVVSQQVGQANVNGTKLKAFPLPLPTVDEQVWRAREHLAVIDRSHRLVGALRVAEAQDKAMRRGLLDAAFSGRLSGRSTDNEVIEELASV